MVSGRWLASVLVPIVYHHDTPRVLGYLHSLETVLYCNRATGQLRSMPSEGNASLTASSTSELHRGGSSGLLGDRVHGDDSWRAKEGDGRSVHVPQVVVRCQGCNGRDTGRETR
jgi:hypothetical protein